MIASTPTVLLIILSACTIVNNIKAAVILIDFSPNSDIQENIPASQIFCLTPVAVINQLTIGRDGHCGVLISIDQFPVTRGLSKKPTNRTVNSRGTAECHLIEHQISGSAPRSSFVISECKLRIEVAFLVNLSYMLSNKARSPKWYKRYCKLTSLKFRGSRTADMHRHSVRGIPYRR